MFHPTAYGGDGMEEGSTVGSPLVLFLSVPEPMVVPISGRDPAIAARVEIVANVEPSSLSETSFLVRLGFQRVPSLCAAHLKHILVCGIVSNDSSLCLIGITGFRIW